MTPPVTIDALVEALARKMWEQSYATLQDASWDVALQAAKNIPDGQAASCLATVRSKAAEIVTEHFAPLLAARQQVTAERDEARNLFGTNAPTVERVALLMGQTWLEAVCDGGHIVGTVEEFAMASPEDYAACCTVAKAVLAAVDPVKANDRADAAESALATATAEAASLRAEVVAKDRRIAELTETWTDQDGKPWFPASARTYAAVVASLIRTSNRVRSLNAEKRRLQAEVETLTAGFEQVMSMSAREFVSFRDNRTALARAATAREGA